MAAAIGEFGFRVPVLIRSNGEIVDGHLRFKAAKVAGLDEVPCMLADDMTETQVRAFRLSVNKVAELAKWDEELLLMELQALGESEYDLSPIGFSEAELDNIIGDPQPGGGKDNVPVAPVIPISALGDIWLCGDHRVMCGDSTSLEAMAALTGGGCVDMVFTDPPYNVDYQGRAGKIKNDKMSTADFERFLEKTFHAIASVLEKGCPMYVAHADFGRIGIDFRAAFIDAGFHLSGCLIWRKNHFTLGRSDYQWLHEPILYGWKKGGPHRWYGGRKKKTIQEFGADTFVQVGDNEYQVAVGDEVLTITGENLQVRSDWPTIIAEDKPLKSVEHPTMKPVALVERFIRNSSKKGDTVLDAFGGSGTTMIAADLNGRVAVLMEFDPKFVDVIVLRWQEFTGREATLEGDGRTFAEIYQERLGK